MENNNESDDLCRFERTRFSNYDNCIVSKHEDDESDESSENNFALDIVGQTAILTSDDENSLENIVIDLQEAFALMVGILVKAEKHFNNKNKTEDEEKMLIKDMKLIKELLINSEKNFGYKTSVDKNGSICLKRYNCSKKAMSTNKAVQTSEDIINLDQVDSPVGVLQKEMGLPINRKKKNSNKTSIDKIDESLKPKKGRKRKASSPKNITQDKKKIKSAETKSTEKATMITKSTPPNKCKTAIKSAVSEAGNIKNNLTAVPKQTITEKGTNRYTRRTCLPYEIRASKVDGSNKHNLSLPQKLTTDDSKDFKNQSKRKLYSQEMWLSELFKIKDF